MNYYPFHIGDFRSGTVNMSRQSRWIYRDMLDVYYDTEKPLSLDIEELCDQLGAESDDERRIVERLLRFKFVKTEDGYRHAICDQVIAEYHVKADVAKTNGKKGGRPKKANGNPEKPSGFQSGSDQLADSLPQPAGSQTNQEPITNKEEEPPKPPVGGLKVVPKPEGKPKGRGIALKTFLDDCKAKGIRPIRDYEPLWNYTRTAKLPDDFVALAWVEYCRQFGPGGVKESNLQKDWRKAFRNYVEKNYLKLWAIDANGEYFLTTQGKQAQTVAEAA